MSSIAREFASAAESLAGAAFNQHYVNGDPCIIKNGGNLTDPRCMERGLGQRNQFDCMGVAISSMCRVYDIRPQEQWPRSCRHVEQFASMAPWAEPMPHIEGGCERTELGAVAVFYNSCSWPAHIGVITNERGGYVHATRNGGVELSALQPYHRVAFISAVRFANVPQVSYRAAA